MKIPDYYRMKCAILGRTGSGKTNTGIVYAERLIGEGVPVVIIDPQGDWYGIRSDYPVVVFGGDNGDIPLSKDSGKVAAEFVINERVPVLFDLVLLGENEMRQFATDFATTIWRSNRDAVHIFLDEADLFAPQSSKYAAKSLGAWQNVCRRGRSRGIGLTMITQRPAVLNKDLLTQADPIFFHRLTAPQDLGAVDDYLKYQGRPAKERTELTGKIAKLEVGSAFVLSPGELEVAKTYKIPKRKSFDSSATPEVGKSVNAMKRVAEIDLNKVESSFGEAIKRAKSNDPKELKKRIAQLEKSSNNGPEVERLEKENQELKNRISVFEETLSRISEIVTVGPKRHIPSVVLKPSKNGAVKTEPKTPKVSPAAIPDDLSKAESKILQAAFWIKDDEVIDLSKISLYSGYRQSGSFSTAIGTLRKRGYLDGLKLTAEGTRVVSQYSDPKPEGSDLVVWLKEKLNTCEKKILDFLLEADDLKSREEISEGTGYSQSGSFSTALARLKKMEAIEGNGNEGFQCNSLLIG